MISAAADPAAYKLALRIDYIARTALKPARCYAEAVERSRNFWPTYEQVNIDYCPWDPVYSISRAGAAVSTTADHLHFKASATGEVKLLEIMIGGEATVSAVNRLALEREATTLATPTAITPEKFNTASQGAAGTYGHSNTGAILAAGIYFRLWSLNAFGAFDDWKPPPGAEPQVGGGEVCGIRSLSGVSIFSSTVVFEEL